MSSAATMEKLISLAKRRGFIFPGSDIYGGLANSWDYGPLGVELKNNIKQAWWKSFVQNRFDVVGMDCALMMNPKVWEASGHVGGYSDPLMDCKECKTRHRADKLVEDAIFKESQENANYDPEGLGYDIDKLPEELAKWDIKCPKCGAQNFTDIRQFNLMFKTHMGVTDDTSSEVYLRPETAQGIFVNFKNVTTTSRKKIPFGIAQIGKAFRNEITPGNFIFRTREFDQMEMEYFCHPDESLKEHDMWKAFCMEWLKTHGLKSELTRLRDHGEDELSHYSKATSDVEFLFPFGWGELWGIAHRGDFDLTQHQTHSGKDLHYLDPTTNEKYIPHVIEPSLGADRVLLAFLVSAYDEEEIDGDTRVVLRLNHRLAPFKACVLPLSKKLSEKGQEVFNAISNDFAVDYDESQSIGKRYRRQDEIGTPFCITVDFDSLEDQMVTVRERDTMNQERVAIDQLTNYLNEKMV
ncbi:MAG: glycine--tRNA ligase [SAR324 cluster bacterium]|nr:glycine--tRNA ligase [SAR324 cluster bacterium]